MHHRVLAAQAHHAERHVLDHAGGGLAMHLVAVDEGVLEEGRDGVDVVLCHFANVLEEEGERLEHAVLDVELGDAVLVHERGEHGEGGAGLGDDADGDGGADAGLPLLHAQVVEQRGQHVLGADGLGDEAEGVVGGAADALFVGLEHVEELEADAHPFPGVDAFGPAVGYAADEVDGVFLDFLVAVAEDGGEAREEVFDGRLHGVDADDGDDGTEGAEDGAQDFGVFLAEVFVEDDAEFAHQSVFAALLHDHGDAGDEVGGLLSHGCGFVVESPEDGADDLG